MINVPFFIKSIPLSFHVFWRYIILLPFLAIGAFVISLAGLFPVIGLFVPGTVSAGLVLIGLRCALAARGHGNELDPLQLLTISVIFSLINIVVDLFLPAIFWMVASGLVIAGVEVDPFELLMGLLGLSSSGATLLVILLSPSALASAALAVPMTAAAISATPRGTGTDVFFGLGSGIFSLLIVMTVWMFGGHFFSIFGEIWATFGLMATALWSFLHGNGLPWKITLDPWSAFASTMFMTWASSWFFATAVLAWEHKVEQKKSIKTTRTEAPRITSDDIRDLRARRMQNGPS